MELILNWIDGLSPFQQSMLGSAVFALTSWLAQKLYKKAKSSGAEFVENYSTLDIHKHILHKHFVRSSNIQMASYGSAIALLIAARWALLAVLALIFAFGVNSALDGEWLYVIAAWVSFNWMLEARNWVKDSGDEKAISHVPSEKVAEVSKALLQKPEESVESANQQPKPTPSLDPKK